MNKTFLGIELGSTRIKAALIGKDFEPLASGAFEWENRFENGVWTYHLDDALAGLKTSFERLAIEYKQRYSAALKNIGGIGISAMMHGYLPFDKYGNPLTPFRTWRNTTTHEAAARLTEEFNFNIPQRWSIAHLYQAILNAEEHVKDIAFITTLAGYVHYMITGDKILGMCDASGMFPIDTSTGYYDERMLNRFNELIAVQNYSWRIQDILPRVIPADKGTSALTASGARLLDPFGVLDMGIPVCPPEGDAATGMTATNAISARTGNISAGTSVFAMLVLDKPLSKLYTEIDMVVTPAGKPVAMVHCNNCTSDLDAWIKLFGEAAALLGVTADKADLYEALYNACIDGEADGGGLVACNYLSGEPVTGFERGVPFVARSAESRFTLANFMRTLLYSSVAALKIGMDIITENENIKIERLAGHGGLFKTTQAGQKICAAALNIPIEVTRSAGEGGAWGAALLAAYAVLKTNNEALEDFLNKEVFASVTVSRVCPDEKDVLGFLEFIKRYKAALIVERTAAENL